MRMPFGKYAGQDTADLEIGYVKWLEEQPWLNDNLRDACQYEIERREGDVTSLGRVIKGPGR